MEFYYLESKSMTIDRSSIFAQSQLPSWDTLLDLLRTSKNFPVPLELVLAKMQMGKVQVTHDLRSISDLWEDYPLNQFAYPFMSERMSTIIREHLTGKEGIAWLSAEVASEDETRTYFLPKFSRQLDTLDPFKTTKTPSGLTIRPWFEATKIQDFAMFHGRPEFWEITTSIVVNEHLMKAIKKAKLTGVSFSPARSS